jgi:hypothetical protein
VASLSGKWELTREVGNARTGIDLGTPRAERHHAPPIGEILQRHAGTLAMPERYLAQTVAAISKAKKAGAGLAAIPGLHRMLGIDAAIEPSGSRGRRSRSAFLGISRSDHGRRGRRGE